MLTCFYVLFGAEGLRPFPHEPGFIMAEMAIYGSARLRAGALVLEGAGLANLGFALVLEGLTILVVSGPFEPLPRGTEVDVVFRVIGEGLIRKLPVSPDFMEGRDMR